MTDQETQTRLFSTRLLERRINELTILYEVSRALQSTVDEGKALQTILVGVTSGRGLGFNRAFLLLVGPEEKYLEGRLAVGPSSREEAERIWRELREKHQTLGEILASLSESSIKRDLRLNELVERIHIPLADEDSSLVKVMRSREVATAQNGTYVPHGLPVEPYVTQLLGSETFAVAPLCLAGRELGVLIADNAITLAPIEPGNLRLLQIYAQAASSAIQNTRLYRELMENVVLCEQINSTLRENQHHLLQAERLSTIGKMAALLAHEIRTPLVSIGGFARRMLRSTESGDPRQEEMQIIVSEVHRLERLVDEILGYSRISLPEYAPTDVNGLIRSLIMTMQEELQKGSIRVNLNLYPDLPSAMTDAAQLRQALMNLVTNAMEAMPSGGMLTVATTLQDKFFEIEVSDTGVGIHGSIWDKLFTPFFTTKATGTGLGLAIVSQVIDNHNGSLRFESIPMQGTSFHVRLALHPDRLPPPDAGPRSDSAYQEARP